MLKAKADLASFLLQVDFKLSELSLNGFQQIRPFIETFMNTSIKKIPFFVFFLVLSLAVKATTRPATTATFVDIYNNQAVDGDTILLDAGTYSTAVAFPTGKSITLKADPAAATQPILTFQLAQPTGDNGSLTFDGLQISRSADYFFNSGAGFNMNAWKFVNCTIKNITKALFNSSSKVGNITSFTIDKCIITACGTSATGFIFVSQTVDNFTVSNSTIYNYVGGDFFKPNNATTTKNITVSFINNTMYKCIWNNGYGWVSVNNIYAAGSTYLFKNNIFDNGANTDPVANKPLLVYRGNGTVTEQNNIKINYQGNNGGTTNATNLTLGSGVLNGFTTIPYADAANADFSLSSTTPFATAGNGGVAVGDPRWIKFASQPVAITTESFPSGAGSVFPSGISVNKGDSIAFSTSRNFGYKFSHWKDEAGNVLSTSSSFKIPVNADIKLIAVYDALTIYNFTTTVKGSQWGSIVLSPAPTNGKYEAGTSVSVTAVPNPIANFLNWEEDLSTIPTKTIEVNSDKSLTAVFDEVSFIVGWSFANTAITSNRPGDFYSETNNTGMLNLYEIVNGAAPVSRGWLASGGGFSPVYPHLRFWSAGAQFKTTRRHLKGQFATTNYKNVQVKSMISGNYQAYSIMTMQYSLDDITYTEFARVNLTGTYGSTWADLNAMLPAAAENQPKVYIKWIADETSPIINEGTDNDGTAITNIYVLADKNIPPDADAPTLISVVPADASSTATVKGSIVVTFNERVQAGTGNVTLGSKTLSGVFGSKTATYAYEKLSYDTEYTFTIPANALTDMSGNAFEGIVVKFRTAKRTEPTKKLFDAVVAKDGSGDYTSVTDALNAAPSGRTQPWLIFIKNGTYKGHHVIPSTKPFIHLIGQSRSGVLIKDSLTADNGSITDRSTLVVQSTDIYLENFTLENSHGYVQQNGPMAEALNTDKDRFAMKNVYVRSYQDTWMTGGSISRQYVLNSRIEGAVDFIYGSGDIFFDRDTLTVTKAGSYIVAPSHGSGTTWGYVFRDNVINQNKDKVSGSINSVFGRPWQNAPKAVFINSKLLTGISPEGWAAWYTAPGIFADYGTMDANGNPVDLSLRRSLYTSNGNNVTVKNSLTDQEAATYTYENVMLKTGDTWDPRMMAEAPESPSNVVVSNAALSWNSVDYTRLYVVLRNNSVIGFTTGTTYTDATAVNGQNYSYAIQAVSEYGALSAATTATGVLPVTGIELKATLESQSIAIKWSTRSEHNTAYFEVERSSDGSFFNKIAQVKANGNTQTKSNYLFNDTQVISGNMYYRIKAVDTDGSYSFSNIDIVNALSVEALVIYPTITDGLLNIKYPVAGLNTKLEVYSISGVKMLSQKLQPGSTQTSLEVGNLLAGTYIIVYPNGSKVLTSKFLKL